MNLPSFIAKLILSHFWLKLGSLFLATLIWFSVRSQSRSDRTFVGIPYDIRNIPGNLEIVERGNDLLRIVVQGPQNLITTLRQESISISLELPDAVRSGEITLELTPNNVQLPYANQLSVIQISPESVTIRLEDLVSKFVKIQPYIRGAVANGFELGSWEIIPSLAQIRGPTSIIESLDSVFTEAIEVNGLSMSFNQRVEVKPSEKLVMVIEPAQVTATIRIIEKHTSIEFSEVPVKFRTTPGMEASDPIPASVKLMINGPMRVVSSIDPKTIEILIDCIDLQPGRHVILASWQGPEGITTTSIIPDHIDVLISPIPAVVTPVTGTDHGHVGK